MGRDYIQFLRTHAAWEWFNPDTGKHNNPLYVAIVALPYVTLQQAGLLQTGRSNKTIGGESVRKN